MRTQSARSHPMTDRQRIALRTELESWNGFLTDRCYQLKVGMDIDSLLQEW